MRTSQTFYLGFAGTGFGEAAKTLKMLERDGPADFGVVRTLLCAVVLLQPFLQVIGAAYIERCVCALQNIGKMIHIVIVYYFHNV